MVAVRAAQFIQRVLKLWIWAAGVEDSQRDLGQIVLDFAQVRLSLVSIHRGESPRASRTRDHQHSGADKRHLSFGRARRAIVCAVHHR